MSALHDAIIRAWRKRGPVAWLLWPLSWVYRAVVHMRRLGYQIGLFTSEYFDTPVVVIGNISSGGEGKTPVTIAICEHLRTRGWRPGIVSRGYGGDAKQWPQPVNPDSSPALVGDEPVLLATSTGCPVYVSPDRPDAVRTLLEAHDCDIILSDDGLQHLALQRDIEIAVVNENPDAGNGFCLPAGPLREPRSRLKSVDFVVNTGSTDIPDAFPCRFEGQVAVNLKDAAQRKTLGEFGGTPIHGVAGIGRPDRFFRHLTQAGVQLIPHAFPDHHKFLEQDLSFAGEAPVLMTEKDAVKCAGFDLHNVWSVPITAIIDSGFYTALDHRLASWTPDQTRQ